MEVDLPTQMDISETTKVKPSTNRHDSLQEESFQAEYKHMAANGYSHNHSIVANLGSQSNLKAAKEKKTKANNKSMRLRIMLDGPSPNNDPLVLPMTPPCTSNGKSLHLEEIPGQSQTRNVNAITTTLTEYTRSRSPS